jgi:hypothetical protein
MGETVGTLSRARRRPITGNVMVDADLYTGINKNNPFGQGDPQSYNELVNQVGWGLNQANNLRSLVSNFQSRLGVGGGTGAFSAGGPFAPVMNPATTAPTSASAGGNNLFSLVNVSKDPSGQFDKINRGLLDKVADFKNDYSQVRGTSSGALEKLNLAQGDIDANRQDTNSLIDKFNALSPILDTQTSAQTSALNRVYDPNGLKAELRSNTEAARLAELAAADRASRQALFQNRLNSAGGAGSSYAQAQLADAMGRIGTEVAARDADRRRQDTAALLGAQERNLGRVQDLNVANLMRGNIPIDARSRILDQEVNLAIRRLGAAGQAASIDQLTDELSTVGRQLGLTGQALQNYLATNFFGIQKQGDDYPLYISGGSSRATPNAYFPQPDYGDDGAFMNPRAGQPQDPTPSWVDRLRASQGWQRDANGNYTINTRPPNYRDFTYNLPNNFTDYGNPRSPLYSPGYQGADNTRLLQDYYENPENYPDGNPITEFNDYVDYYNVQDW